MTLGLRVWASVYSKSTPQQTSGTREGYCISKAGCCLPTQQVHGCPSATRTAAEGASGVTGPGML